jgi:hypothetical protein
MDPSDSDYTPNDNLNTNISTPVKFEAEPFSGFELMDSYQSIACDSSVLRDIRNDIIEVAVVQNAAKFRVDYTESKQPSLSNQQRQIAALVLRMLCRGSITKNTKYVESAIAKLFPGNANYTNGDFSDSRLLTSIHPCYAFDSDREQIFAEEILENVIGPNWTLYTSPQVFIQTMATSAPFEINFAGQRTDFVVSYGNKDFVIELDGEEHLHHQDKDEQRDAFLRENGFKVFRFDNSDVDGDPIHVIDTLSDEIRKLQIQAIPQVSLRKELWLLNWYTRFK